MEPTSLHVTIQDFLIVRVRFGLWIMMDSPIHDIFQIRGWMGFSDFSRMVHRYSCRTISMVRKPYVKTLILGWFSRSRVGLRISRSCLRVESISFHDMTVQDSSLERWRWSRRSHLSVVLWTMKWKWVQFRKSPCSISQTSSVNSAVSIRSISIMVVPSDSMIMVNISSGRVALSWMHLSSWKNRYTDSTFLLNMTLFLTIFLKLIPLYLMILLGYISSRFLSVQKESIGKLLIYIIAPVVIFYGTYTAKLDPVYFFLPVLFFSIACIIALVFYILWGKIYGRDTTRNILAFTSGTGNTWYFGLPVISATLGDSAFSIAVLSVLGVVLYENTLGFYLTAKWNFTARESMLKVVKLPTVYAFLFGLILNFSGIELWEIARTTMQNFKWWYTLLGMMIIGMWLVWARITDIDTKFISLTFIAKFIIWPIMMFTVTMLDRLYFRFFDPSIVNVLLILSLVPLAANTVAIATELKTHPEKASLAVLLSTLFALFFIPAMVSIFHIG